MSYYPRIPKDKQKIHISFEPLKSLDGEVLSMICGIGYDVCTTSKILGITKGSVYGKIKCGALAEYHELCYGKEKAYIYQHSVQYALFKKHYGQLNAGELRIKENEVIEGFKVTKGSIEFYLTHWEFNAEVIGYIANYIKGVFVEPSSITLGGIRKNFRLYGK